MSKSILISVVLMFVCSCGYTATTIATTTDTPVYQEIVVNESNKARNQTTTSETNEASWLADDLLTLKSTDDEKTKEYPFMDFYTRYIYYVQPDQKRIRVVTIPTPITKAMRKDKDWSDLSKVSNMITEKDGVFSIEKGVNIQLSKNRFGLVVNLCIDYKAMNFDPKKIGKKFDMEHPDGCSEITRTYKIGVKEDEFEYSSLAGLAIIATLLPSPQ